jgi:hypothetical protein
MRICTHLTHACQHLLRLLHGETSKAIQHTRCEIWRNRKWCSMATSSKWLATIPPPALKTERLLPFKNSTQS